MIFSEAEIYLYYTANENIGLDRMRASTINRDVKHKGSNISSGIWHFAKYNDDLAFLT